MYLNCHTYFSFKFGTIKPEELLQQAAVNSVHKFVVSDINNTSAILDCHRLVTEYPEKYPVQPIAGIDFREGAQQKFIGIAKNHQGFHELNTFLTKCLHEDEKGLSGREGKIPDRAPEFENAFVIYPFSRWSGSPFRESEGSVSIRQLCTNELIGIKPSDLTRFRFSKWKSQPEKLVILAPVTFRNKTDFNSHRLLRAMDNNIVLSKLAPADQALPDEIMFTEEELQNIYKDFPQIIYNTKKLLDECEPIDFEFGKNKNRKYYSKSVRDDAALLRKLCKENLTYRYPKPDKIVHERFEHELKLITELGYSSYFLINWDIVRYAQFRNFFYVGRGSGANSMIAYLLKITDVDPIELNLFFERFINAFRTSPPDFDIDFSWTDRDAVMEYIFSRYGRDYTSLLGAYSTFQADSVVRELGKVFGLPKAEIDALQDPHLYPPAKDHITKLIYQYARCLHDFPNHLTIHASGILISEKPLTYYTAISNPPKGFPLPQFSMLEAEDVGFAKFDILSQRGLGHIKDATKLVEKNRGEKIDIHDVQRFKNDKQISERLKAAKLIGCFYVESPAMRMLLTKLRATTYLDLVAASSIIRPGVAQSGMMQEYIRRFHDPERAKKVGIPQLLELMPETFGVMVYQEDVIKVAHQFAGLTLGEADMLRRGMNGKYRGRAEFQKVEQKFFSNCKEKGYPDELTKEVWREIESFAGYAFAKGHSASFAVESYQSMFLKTYYPLEFMVGVINNFGGFYRTEYYVHEAYMSGGTIHAPDINKSIVATSLHGKNIFLGFNLIADLEKNIQPLIVEERLRNGDYLSLENFMKRISIAVEQLRILIRIGAFRFTGRTKQELLWDIHKILGHEKKSVARKELFDSGYKDFSLPHLDEIKFRDVVDQIEILGFPLQSPFDLIKPSSSPIWGLGGSGSGGHPELVEGRGPVEGQSGSSAPNVMVSGVEPLLASDLPKFKNKIISIIGYYVTYKPTRTKKGEAMMFGCFLDRDGCFFDTNHFPEATRKFPFKGKGCYLIKGKVAEEFGFYSINVIEMHKINYMMYEEDAETKARSKPDPVIVPPMVPASKQYEYLLVISPPPHVWNEVMMWKKKFHQRLDHYQAAITKPHITLCKLFVSQMKEEEIIKQIASVADRHASLRVSLENFDSVPSHTIFINVLNPDYIIDIVSDLKKQLSTGLLTENLPPKSSRFIMHPCLAIAKGLDRDKFARASAEFCEQKYAASFVASGIVLLKREANVKFAKYEVVKEFRLERKISRGGTESQRNQQKTFSNFQIN